MGLNGANGTLGANQGSNGYAINAYWKPVQSGFVPSFSLLAQNPKPFGDGSLPLYDFFELFLHPGILILI
jgi:hypothetical protein